jgi:hypothetical protein
MPMKEPPERTRENAPQLLEMKSSFDTPQSTIPPLQNESYERMFCNLLDIHFASAIIPYWKYR